MNIDAGKPVDINLKDVKPDSAYYYEVNPDKVSFRIPGNLIDNPQKASDEAKKLSEWINARNGQRILVRDNPTGLDYVVCGKDSFPISYQLFTDALTGRIENIPDYIKSWDRLNLKGMEKINGEDYLRFEQEPSHGSWKSTRWDQIFNHLKFTPGNKQDEEAMKDIIAFNVKKQYGFDLDKNKIIIKGHKDAIGSWGVFDVLYMGDAPGHVVRRTGSKTTAPGHILIQEKAPIWLRQSDIPLERILYQTPIVPDTTRPAIEDTSKKSEMDTSKVFAIGNNVVYFEGGIAKVVDLNRFGPYFGIGVEGKNASIGLYGLLAMRNNNSDSLWQGPFGYTSNSVHEKIRRAQLGIEGLLGGKNMKIGLGVAYNVENTETGGTYHEEVEDMNGNVVVRNNGDLPVKKDKTEFVSAGPRVEFSGNRIGVIVGANYQLNKREESKSAEYFAGLRLFLGQRDKHKDPYKSKLTGSTR